MSTPVYSFVHSLLQDVKGAQITDEDFRDYIEEHKTHKQYKYKYDHDHIFVPRGHKYMTNLGFLFVVSFAET